MLERIILAHDRRGISRLRDLLAPAYCHDAAAFLLEHRGHALILTGFYVAGTAETDGPPGAIALARALGGRCTLVSDRYGVPLLRGAAPDLTVEEVGIAGEQESRTACAALLARLQPTLVVAIERCGATAAGAYLNMRGLDISAHTARLDPLLEGVPSVAIGDGGNEIGMGALAEPLVQLLGLAEPCRTRADRLVIGAVSNWGAYAVIAALSLLVGRNLLPSAASQEALLADLVAAGAVDGVTGRHEPTVDGFTAPYHAAVLAQLREYLQTQGLQMVR